MQEEAKPDRTRRWVFGLIVAALILVPSYLVVTGAIRAHVSEKVASVIGRSLPDFELVDTTGKAWSKKDLLGKKVMLSFFRSQCASCKAEKVAVKTLAKELDSSEAVLLSVMNDKVRGYPEAMTRATLEFFSYEHPVVFANQDFLNAFHGDTWAHVTPITLVFDAKGVCTLALRGRQSLQTLRSAIQ